MDTLSSKYSKTLPIVFKYLQSILQYTFRSSASSLSYEIRPTKHARSHFFTFFWRFVRCWTTDAANEAILTVYLWWAIFDGLFNCNASHTSPRVKFELMLAEVRYLRCSATKCTICSERCSSCKKRRCPFHRHRHKSYMRTWSGYSIEWYKFALLHGTQRED